MYEKNAPKIPRRLQFIYKNKIMALTQLQLTKTYKKAQWLTNRSY